MFWTGIGLLLFTLALFTLFSLKCPKGDKAMSGLANAAVASFLTEAVCKYILGDFAGIAFFSEIGKSAGSLGGTAAAILVGLAMGTEPVWAVTSGLALKGIGILPGFISGYILHFLMKPVKKHLPDGVNTIVGALLSAAAAYGVSVLISPGVNWVISGIGTALTAATEQNPVLMGFLLGGIIKIVCTSPLSSMALTAMLGLTGLPMGIAVIACFGGTFTNGVLFKRLRLGTNSQVAAVMMEPLTQADIISRNPLPIYFSDFLGGGLSGIIAVLFGIICNAPGTAAPIPGMLAPFAFNEPGCVFIALGLSAVAGTLCGWIGSQIFIMLNRKKIFLYSAAKVKMV